MARKSSANKIRLILKELRGHLPFTFLGVVSGIVFLGLVHGVFIRPSGMHSQTILRNFFHTFHFSHIFLSAIATTAVFFRHERDILKTVLVGFFGTLIPCGTSDIFIPYFGGKLLGMPMTFHFCLIEEPTAVLLANSAGILVGMIAELKFGRISYFSHSAHVFVSSFASLFYLVSFGIDNWFKLLLGIFVITVVAVVIPCCSSDIVIPLSFVTGAHGHEHEDEHTEKR